MEYKVDKRIKPYVLKELYGYRKNKNWLSKFDNEIESRDIRVIRQNVDAIERVIDYLDDLDKEAFDLMFNRRISQKEALAYGISYDVYYRTRRKIIYYVAYELDLNLRR